MSAKNMVIAGDYTGKGVSGVGGAVQIFLTRKDYVLLDKFGVDAYEVITEETRKSAVSGIARGAVGVTLLGPIGMLAGLSAKNKSTYTISVRFKDGKNSLIEMDEKLYKLFIKGMF